MTGISFLFYLLPLSYLRVIYHTHLILFLFALCFVLLLCVSYFFVVLISKLCYNLFADAVLISGLLFVFIYISIHKIYESEKRTEPG